MDVGDRIEKRGLGHLGTIKQVAENGWISVEWDEGPLVRERPKICDPKELKLVENEGKVLPT